MTEEQQKDWLKELKEYWWNTFNDSGLPNYDEYQEMVCFIKKQKDEAYTRGRSDEAKVCEGCSKRGIDGAVKAMLAQYCQSCLSQVNTPDRCDMHSDYKPKE